MIRGSCRNISLPRSRPHGKSFNLLQFSPFVWKVFLTRKEYAICRSPRQIESDIFTCIVGKTLIAISDRNKTATCFASSRKHFKKYWKHQKLTLSHYWANNIFPTFARLVKIVSFFLRWLMGDRVKALRRENDDLKRQLNELKKEFQSFKSKMAEQKECHEAAAAALPNTQDVQFLSDSYNALVYQ